MIMIIIDEIIILNTFLSKGDQTFIIDSLNLAHYILTLIVVSKCTG
jgi:hypothetical protein